MFNSGSGNYTVNENVTKDGVVVGEVVSWSPQNHLLSVKDNTITLADNDVLIGASSAAEYTIQSIEDVLTFSNDGSAQNTDFETKADEYLDFSETNPFGEVT